MLIEMGHTGNRTLHKAASGYSSLDNKHDTASQRNHLREVLCELRDLLEDYAPAWYTEEHHRRVEAALHPKKRKH
jgi:hypothetical protein